MSKIVDIKVGQSLPGERLAEAAENLERIFQMIATCLLLKNNDGMGKQYAEEFMFIDVSGKGNRE